MAIGFVPEDAGTLRHACSLAGQGGGALQLVHVCPAPSPALDPVHVAEMYLDSGEHAREARQAAADRLAALHPPSTSLPGVRVTSEAVLHQDAAVALREAADRFAADVICTGSRGPSRLGAALLGSTAQSVNARAHRPVLVVPPLRK